MKKSIRVTFLESDSIDESSESCNIGNWEEVECCYRSSAKLKGDG